MTAFAIFALLVVMLGSILLHELDVRKDVQNDIAMKNTRMMVLTSECKRVKDAINLQNNDISIRQAALRMGLINSQGVAAQYLEVPADAVITLPAQTGIQSLASIWGQ